MNDFSTAVNIKKKIEKVKIFLFLLQIRFLRSKENLLQKKKLLCNNLFLNNFNDVDIFGNRDLFR